jgi:hypothetical protein
MGLAHVQGLGQVCTGPHWWLHLSVQRAAGVEIRHLSPNSELVLLFMLLFPKAGGRIAARSGGKHPSAGVVM